MSRKIKVGITQGDYNGVGPEVILKALADEMIPELFTPVIFGNARVFEKVRKDLNIDLPYYEVVRNAGDVREGKINIVDLKGDLPYAPGKPTEESGRAAVRALEMAVEALKKGSIDVVVTAPICKANVQSEQFSYPGHTEFFEASFRPEPAADAAGAATESPESSAKTPNPASLPGVKAQMILFDERLRVALVTTHLPVGEIAAAITKEKVLDSIERFDKVLRKDFGCERPKIAVLALNPHCGDNGLLGNEEKEVIVPAIKEAESKGLLCFGPYAADGFFASEHWRSFDGVLAMYHDQGLAPFKALAGAGGVNFTAGLPIVRTSPDHGTAFDIAGKGEADATSMRQAIYNAIDIRRNRVRYEKAASNPLGKARIERAGADKTVDLSKDTL